MSFGCEYNSKEQEGTMSTKLMDGALYANMIKSGAAELSDNIKLVNDLNVFPIPDGDTGDNMFMTIDSGAAHLTDESETSIFKIADRAAGGMLLGARGNSGVILSRIFAGIAKGLKDKDSVNVPMFSKAMESGVKEAYGAVSVPVEGTILTVYKDGVRYANSRVTNGSSFDDYFNDLIWELKRSLDRTPDLLAVLKEAGVVDSGGAGFIYIAEGMKKAIGGEILSEGAQPLSARKNIDLNAFTEDSVLEFGYCTEFLLRLQKAKIDIDSFDIDALISWLNSVGDSVVAFREGTIVKVHVHTKKPGDVFNYVQQFGEFLTMKIENMTLQHNETHAQKQFEPKPKKPHKKYGIVSVATGDGIKDTFLSLGCDCVVDGGQLRRSRRLTQISFLFSRTTATLLWRQIRLRRCIRTRMFTLFRARQSVKVTRRFQCSTQPRTILILSLPSKRRLSQALSPEWCQRRFAIPRWTAWRLKRTTT